MMIKIVMLLWVLGPDGVVLDPIEFGGWRSVADCEAFADSFFVANPADGFQFEGVARCVEVPK